MIQDRSTENKSIVFTHIQLFFFLLTNEFLIMILKKTKKTESIQVPKDVITKERTQYYLAAQWTLYISSDTGHQSLCCHTPLEKKKL